MKLTAFLVLLICIASSDLNAQDRQTDDLLDSVDMGERRLHFELGAGLQQGFYAGILWSIPMTSDLQHHFCPEVTAGVRPGRWSMIPSAALSWQYLSINKGVGAELKAKGSFEKWKINADELTQRRVSLSPGIIARLSKSLISFSVGPGVAFISRFAESGGKTLEIEESELAFDVALGITF